MSQPTVSLVLSRSTPKRELGARAVRLILRQLEPDARTTPVVQTLPVELVLRGTTDRPATPAVGESGP